MIELIALTYTTKQFVLLGVGLGILGLLIGFGVLFFLKMRAVKDEHSVESLPTLADLGLEHNEDDSSVDSDEDEDSAFFEDEDDESFMDNKFLG